MQVHTQAIVLNYTKYSDRSIIAQVFTQGMGRQSVMVHGIGGKKKNKLSAFQPLFIHQMVIYKKSARSIQTLKEYKLSPPLMGLTMDVRKSAMSLFIAEVLSKSLREESGDEELFQFLSTSIQILDKMEAGLGLFHLAFLLKLSRFLGFAPPSQKVSEGYYNYKDGSIQHHKPAHNLYCDHTVYNGLSELLLTPYNNLQNIDLSLKRRDELMEALLNIYEIHIINFNNLNSFVVLQEVFAVQ